MTTFGPPMRREHFLFDPRYTPLNHGSYGSFPRLVRDYQREVQDSIEARSDAFIRLTIPKLLEDSRAAVAPLLGAAVDEVVFVPNATTAVNVVLRTLVFAPRDVILYFSTAYKACAKTILSVCETTPAEPMRIDIKFPLEDDELVAIFRRTVEKVNDSGRRARIAMFDTVVSFPGVRMPWESLIAACRELDVLSLIDGAHGVGHIDLSHLGATGPDFFASNCYKLV